MTSKENNIDIPIYGLVLAGGKSSRMGADKGMIDWHGKPQRYHVADMLTPLCDAVFISCRTDQAKDIIPDYAIITDSLTIGGPLAGIISAFEQYPHVAWLVTACDLPLLDTDTLQYLIANRNPHTMATTYKSPADELPEPLITIWEPQSYKILLSFMNNGYKCPRKILINNDITLLDPSHPAALLNANTPVEADLVRLIINE